MYEKLEKLRKESLVELSAWAGLSLTPGTEGVLVTKDKKMYIYHFYKYISPSLEGKVEKEYVSDGVLLSDEVYSKLISYIEDNIIDKKHKDEMMFDLSLTIKVNYKNKEIKVVNNMDMYGDLRKIVRGEENEK